MTLRHAIGSLLLVSLCLGCLALPESQARAQDTASKSEGEPVPWDGATDVTLPPFLRDTDKRVVEERQPPSDAQLEALRQLEEEVERFRESGETFRSTVTSLVRREYLQQRRERDRWYGEQLEAEERSFNEARDTSIRVFEEFVARYPNQPNYTPDAMFRLGELYFERSAMNFQKLYDDAQAAREAGDSTAEDALPTSPDFTATIEIYKALAARFPAVRALRRCLLPDRLHLERDGPSRRGGRGVVGARMREQVPLRPAMAAAAPQRLSRAASQVPCAHLGRAPAGRSRGRRIRRPVRKLPPDLSGSSFRERDLVPDR